MLRPELPPSQLHRNSLRTECCTVEKSALAPLGKKTWLELEYSVVSWGPICLKQRISSWNHGSAIGYVCRVKKSGFLHEPTPLHRILANIPQRSSKSVDPSHGDPSFKVTVRAGQRNLQELPHALKPWATTKVC